MYKILVTGDRKWKDSRIVEDVLRQYYTLHKENLAIIQGCCSGADRAAQNFTIKYGCQNLSFPAEWDKYGKVAGPIRNTKMLEQSPDLVIAFHDDIHNSKGTKDTVTKALFKGVKVYLYNNKGEVSELTL